MEILNRKQALAVVKNHAGFYTYGLYRNDKNEVFYIGKGTGRRVFSHLSNSKRIVNQHKHNIIQKVGKENISFIIWPANSEEEAFRKEAEMVDRFKDTICNLTTGGDGGFSLSEETKEKLRKAKKGYRPNIEAVKAGWTPEKRQEQSELQKTIQRYYSEDSKRRMGWRKGTSDSEETKEKKRKSWTPERRAAQAERARQIASHLSEEQKKDRSNRMVGNTYHERVKRKPMSEETKEKIRQKLLGKKLSQETRDKISASSKAAAQRRRRDKNGKFIFERIFRETTRMASSG